jgi:hypothetical protein
LAKALKPTFVTTHTKGEEQALIEDALVRSGVVLICRRHQNIAAIGNLIVGNDTTVPQSWPEGGYDLFGRSVRDPELSAVLSRAAGHILDHAGADEALRRSAEADYRAVIAAARLGVGWRIGGPGAGWTALPLLAPGILVFLPMVLVGV